MLALAIARLVRIVIRIREARRPGLLLMHWLGGWSCRSAFLNELVQLATVQPHSSALRAVVDFDALALAHG
jgi:hypothetical protein